MDCDLHGGANYRMLNCSQNAEIGREKKDPSLVFELVFENILFVNLYEGKHWEKNAQNKMFRQIRPLKMVADGFGDIVGK